MRINEMQKQGADILQARQHFEMLDALRGVAAISIVLFHFMEIVYSDYSVNFIGHGFLAVDFFFCLSGFVIAYAYDNRIEKMGRTVFFSARLIRLQPLVIAGSVFGLLGFLFDPFAGHPELYSTGKIILVFICSVLLIPFPVLSERYFNLFSFNAPAWSLFWEYIANILYAFVLYKISRRWLILLMLPAALSVCFVCYRAGSLMGGWAGENFWDGGARIAYSFLAGMFVYRSNWIIKNGLGFITLSVLLVLAFIMPWSAAWNWLTEPLVVLFYFPFLIAVGAGSILTQRSKRAGIFSGKISYPLYMTHYTAMWIFANYYHSYKPGMAQLVFIIAGTTIFLVCAAYLVMILYDAPVRNYLTKKRHQAAQSTNTIS